MLYQCGVVLVFLLLAGGGGGIVIVRFVNLSPLLMTQFLYFGGMRFSAFMKVFKWLWKKIEQK